MNLQQNKLNAKSTSQELKQRLEGIKNFIMQPKCKETFVMKSVIYNYINRFWDGKCFLLRANAKKDMRILFEQDFTKPFKEYIRTNHDKDKDMCIDCGRPMGNKERVSIAFMKDMADDLARKKSAFWNCKVDAFLCPACAFVYAASPLGFTHFEPLTPAELLQIETIINEEIMSCTPVKNYEMGIEEAKAKGAMALFSEKYGNVVRVVEIGDFSMELCGGTHVKNTGELGLFKIVSESSVAAGVRRIEAVTGIGYLNATRALEATLFQAAGVLKLQSASELVKRCETLAAEVKEKDREINLLNSKLAGSKINELLKSAHEEGGVLVVTGDLSGVNAEMLRSMGDQLRDKAPAICALLCGGDAEKKNFLCVAGPAAVKAGVHAGKIIKAVCQKTGGNGGGRPDSAMGGVGDPLLVEDAMSTLPDLIHEMLK